MTDTPQRVTTITGPMGGMCTYTLVQQHPEGRVIELAFKYRDGAEGLQASLDAQAKSMDHLLAMSVAQIERELRHVLVPLAPEPKPDSAGPEYIGLNEDGTFVAAVETPA